MNKPTNGAFEKIELLASAARTDVAEAYGSEIEWGDVEKALVLLNITASATEAGDTLDVYLDVSWDGGTTWLNAVHFTQQAGNGAAAKELAVLDLGYTTDPDAVLAVTADAAAGVVRQQLLGPLVRVRYTIVEVTTDNSSHTFDVQAYVK